MLKNLLKITKLSKTGMSSFTPKKVHRVQGQKTSIWIQFGALAVECQAVNLGQGFLDGPAPKFVTDALSKASADQNLWGVHQYTRGFGHPALVSALSKVYSDLNGFKIDQNDEILVTVGAYLALYYCFNGWIEKGDEVIIFEPAYDSYVSQVQLAGGKPVPVTMKLAENAKSSADFTIDFDELERKINKNTKMMVINNPHNPTGKLHSRAELEQLAEIAKKHDLIVVADEVYEFHVWEGQEMVRMASLPGMYERTISIGSAGKAFSVTGWKLGWAVGPKHLLDPLKAIHQNCVYTCATPTQFAVAEAFEKDFANYHSNPKESYLATGMADELLVKRNKLAEILKAAGLNPIIPDSGYFMVADFRPLNKQNLKFPEEDAEDFGFSKWLCREKKLATIPMTAFCSDPEGKRQYEHFVRFCFFKNDKTLDAAEKILKNM